MIKRIDHAPARMIELLEVEDFEGSRTTAAATVAGTMAGEPVVFLVPDANALCFLWVGWWIGRHHERDCAGYRCTAAYIARPAKTRRRRRARSDNPEQLFAIRVRLVIPRRFGDEGLGPLLMSALPMRGRNLAAADGTARRSGALPACLPVEARWRRHRVRRESRVLRVGV